MKLHAPKYLSFLVVLFLFACSNERVDNSVLEEQLDPSQPFEDLNVAYGNHPRQVLDIYLPENRTNSTKTMILIHGGGWTSGDKSDMDPIVLLVQRELPHLAIVNINYRLADADNPPYPMQIDDITTAITFLKENKTKYSISEDIGFIGTSAGGHLALLWSYGFDVENQVDMVCSIVGPTNFTDPAYLNSTDPLLQLLLNAFAADATTKFLEDASPFHQVNMSAPPSILFYGGKDPLVPVSQGTDLRDKLQDLGVTHEFTLYENAGHGWDGLELLDTWAKLKLFAETHL